MDNEVSVSQLEQRLEALGLPADPDRRDRFKRAGLWHGTVRHGREYFVTEQQAKRLEVLLQTQTALGEPNMEELAFFAAFVGLDKIPTDKLRNRLISGLGNFFSLMHRFFDRAGIGRVFRNQSPQIPIERSAARLTTRRLFRDLQLPRSPRIDVWREVVEATFEVSIGVAILGRDARHYEPRIRRAIRLLYTDENHATAVFNWIFPTIVRDQAQFVFMLSRNSLTHEIERAARTHPLVIKRAIRAAAFELRLLMRSFAPGFQPNQAGADPTGIRFYKGWIAMLAALNVSMLTTKGGREFFKRLEAGEDFSLPQLVQRLEKLQPYLLQRAIR